MNELNQELRRFVRLFEQLKLRYAVMGGFAVRAHGIPRPTQDIDFTVALPRDRLAEFFAAAKQLGYGVPEPYEAGWVDQVGEMPLVRVERYVAGRGIDVDLFLAESPFQQELLLRARPERLDDIDLYIVTPEDLILLKLLAHRPRDLADIGDVLFTQGTLDEAYLRKWAEELGISAQLERVLAEPPPI